jgi:hypothetical protein
MSSSFRPQGVGDCLHNARAVLQDIVIPKPQHSPTSRLQFGVAALVILRTGVLSSIGLDNETCLNAGKIHDEWRHPVLPTKPRTQLTSSQCKPQYPFRIRCFRA